MKKLIFILAIVLGSLTAHAKESVIVLIANGEVFYFQVGKVMKGGVVEVYDPTGKLVTTKEITEKRTTIELQDLLPGEYVLKIVKKSKDQSFEYHAGAGHAKVSMRDEITVSLKIEAEIKRSDDELHYAARN